MSENFIARNIRLIRAKRDWTQSDLADKAGVSLRTIQAIENQGQAPRADNLIAISEALKVSVSEIVGEPNTSLERTKLLEAILIALPALDNSQLSDIGDQITRFLSSKSSARGHKVR